MLTPTQKDFLNLYLKSFLSHGKVSNYTENNSYQSFWQDRLNGIVEIKKIVSDFLDKRITLKEFKEVSSTLSIKHSYWGFKGFSGQMQLNQYANNIDDSRKEDVLRDAIHVPKNLKEACEKIDTMAAYLASVKESSESPKTIPRKNLSYMLSYFWEIQNNGMYPVYYGSSKKVLEDLGLIEGVFETYGHEYQNFAQVMQEIVTHFEEQKVDMGKYPLWFVEHVIWNKYMDKDSGIDVEIKLEKRSVPKIEVKMVASTNIWIPPVIADLEDLAFNKETEWTKDRRILPEKAFETKLKYLFTIMGYETQELGQGKGRQPDGIAISRGVDDGEYAIVYDAKARQNGYDVGTQNREIEEYIRTKKAELKLQRINRVYFVVISSDFGSNPNNISLIREVSRKTQVAITLLKASDLLFIVENKLKNSDLTHTHIEDLFLNTGSKTREQIVDLLSNKIEL